LPAKARARLALRVGSKQDAEKAAELWRFGPKTFKKYYNARDLEEIEREKAARSGAPRDPQRRK